MSAVEQLKQTVTNAGFHGDEFIEAIDRGDHWMFVAYDDNEDIYIVSSFWKNRGDFAGAPLHTFDNKNTAVSYLFNQFQVDTGWR